MGRLLGIATRTATKLPMTSVTHSRITTAAGVDGEFRGKRKALTPEWRAGVACRVLQDGAIAVGDAVSIERA